MMIDVAHAAALVSSEYFEIAPSALIKWPLVWVKLPGNRRKMTSSKELRAYVNQIIKTHTPKEKKPIG